MTRLFILLALLLASCAPVPTPGGTPIRKPRLVVSLQPVQYVIADVLEVRSCPSTACGTLYYALRGDALSISERQRNADRECNNWAQIADKIGGWVCADWLAP